ncbi:MAG: AAA family ATPase, partial [Dehalococcoidia bacterium]
MRPGKPASRPTLGSGYDLRRIVVVGSSCSGKTTLANSLSEKLGYSHIELDAIHWLPDWVPRPVEEFRKLTSVVIGEESWVVDGNYSSVRDLVWPRATTLVWLNHPFR